MQVTTVPNPEPEGGYMAYNHETGTVSEGETIEEALAKLREAQVLYLEEFPTKVAGAPLVTTFDVPERARISGHLGRADHPGARTRAC